MSAFETSEICQIFYDQLIIRTCIIFLEALVICVTCNTLSDSPALFRYGIPAALTVRQAWKRKNNKKTRLLTAAHCIVRIIQGNAKYLKQYFSLILVDFGRKEFSVWKGDFIQMFPISRRSLQFRDHDYHAKDVVIKRFEFNIIFLLLQRAVRLYVYVSVRLRANFRFMIIGACCSTNQIQGNRSTDVCGYNRASCNREVRLTWEWTIVRRFANGRTRRP